MQVRVLRSDAELRCYAEGFARTIFERSNGRLRSSVSVEFLRRCKVRGVLGEGGEMIGGYALGTSVPLRLLDFVPEDRRAAVRPPGRSWSQCCEVVCMWRARQLSSAGMTRVWPLVAFDALSCGKPFILGHNENPRLDRLYNRIGAQTLYCGQSSNGLPSRLFAFRRGAAIARLGLFLATEAPARLWRRASRRSFAPVDR